MKKTLITLITVLSLIFVNGKIQAQKVHTLNQKEFIEKIMDYKTNTDKWVFKGDKPVIIDFYASWCGPCQRLAPILHEVAKEYGNKIIIYKIDVDKEKALAKDYKIRSIPTLMFIPVKGEPKIIKGSLPKKEIINLIDDFLIPSK